MALLRVLVEYPGVGIPNDRVEAADITSNPQALVDAGICEWVVAPDVDRRSDIEQTVVAPVRETTAVTPTVRRAPVRQKRENT